MLAIMRDRRRWALLLEIPCGPLLMLRPSCVIACPVENGSISNCKRKKSLMAPEWLLTFVLLVIVGLVAYVAFMR